MFLYIVYVVVIICYIELKFERLREQSSHHLFSGNGLTFKVVGRAGRHSAEVRIGQR